MGEKCIYMQQYFCCCLVPESCPTHATMWTVACQVPLSVGFSRQEYWSGLPFPPPGNLPHPGIACESPALQADSRETKLKISQRIKI